MSPDRWDPAARMQATGIGAFTATRVFCIARFELERLRQTHPIMHIKLTGLAGRDVAEKLRQTTSVLGGQVHRIRIADGDEDQRTYIPWNAR